MIEDRQNAWDSYEGFLKDLDGLRSYLDDPKGYYKPNMMIVTEPREDGRDYIMFEDYITEGEENESYKDYANRVGRRFAVVQDPYVCMSTESIDDAVEKWNSGNARNIYENAMKRGWKEKPRERFDIMGEYDGYGGKCSECIIVAPPQDEEQITREDEDGLSQEDHRSGEVHRV